MFNERTIYVLRVLNDGNEWETVTQQFLSEQAALDYFNTEMDGLDLWADYEIESVEQAQ